MVGSGGDSARNYQEVTLLRIRRASRLVTLVAFINGKTASARETCGLYNLIPKIFASLLTRQLVAS